MNEFVEQCRREWRRLHVPARVADEMAAELAADLEQAQAEGASHEDVLGRGALDPRSFAASWASERGVGWPSRSRDEGRRVLAVAAIALVVALVVSGALLISVASPSSVQPLAAPPLGPGLGHRAILAKPVGQPAALPGFWTVDTTNAGISTQTVGAVLLTVGLAGAVVLTLFWLWAGRRPRRPAS